MKISYALVAATCLVACGPEASTPPAQDTAALFDADTATVPITDWIEQTRAAGETPAFANPMDALGAEFVKLALHMGRLDANYVDAYHGPAVWRADADELEPDADQLASDISDLRTRLDALDVSDGAAETRKAQLDKLLRAMGVRLSVVAGNTVSFDTEVAEIYDVAPPVYDLSEYDAVLAQIDGLVPGNGDLASRVDAFRNSLAIPEDQLQPVFDRAIAECRARTEAHYTLPEGENFRMEFVTDKSWSGYNYYQGGYESLIQINTDFPIIIDRAVDLGCHEGYPGHHVWNLFIEQELVGERGWIEYTVNPLFGPFGPIAEGSANFGIELAFPANEKIAFERDVLFPMAGLDPADAPKLAALNALTGQLSHATNEVARRYLDGDITREDAVPLIQRYYLASTEKSAQRVSFIDTYRGYVINYNMGRDLAREWVDAAGDDTDARWDAFKAMLTGPITASDIVAARD